MCNTRFNTHCVHVFIYLNLSLIHLPICQTAFVSQVSESYMDFVFVNTNLIWWWTRIEGPEGLCQICICIDHIYLSCLFSRWISVEGHQKCLTTICICICIHKNINVCSCLLVIWKTRIEGQQGREILLLNSSLGRSRSASWNIKQI